MRKVLKLAGIALTLVVVLAVLMTSVAMAGGPEDQGDQTRTKDCTQTQECICDQTQTQDCTQTQERICDQTQTQDCTQTQERICDRIGQEIE